MSLWSDNLILIDSIPIVDSKASIPRHQAWSEPPEREHGRRCDCVAGIPFLCYSQDDQVHPGQKKKCSRLCVSRGAGFSGKGEFSFIMSIVISLYKANYMILFIFGHVITGSSRGL